MVDVITVERGVEVTMVEPKDQQPQQGSRIVVGVDGSAASVDALRWAARQAELTGGTLEAVIGWTYPLIYGNEFVSESVDWSAYALTALDTALTEALGTDGPSCTRAVTAGHPAPVLVAASAGADLLVVGSRGHGGFAGMLLGSVSEYVIAHADCPVLVIRHARSTSA